MKQRHGVMLSVNVLPCSSITGSETVLTINLCFMPILVALPAWCPIRICSAYIHGQDDHVTRVNLSGSFPTSEQRGRAQHALQRQGHQFLPIRKAPATSFVPLVCSLTNGKRPCPKGRLVGHWLVVKDGHTPPRS